MKNSQLRSLQVYGAYDAKAEGFLADGASLHICMSAHGPDADSWEKARVGAQAAKIDNTMAFMIESRYAMRLTRYAVESPDLQHDYFQGWKGLNKHYTP